MLNELKKKLKSEKEVYLRLKVRPGAGKTEVKGIMADETIKVEVAAAPVRGRANEELTKFLARQFSVSRNSVKIIKGAGERIKLIKIFL
jgi:uncharacterized protein (TIGR00251 family)